MADNSTYDPGVGGDTYRSKDRTTAKTEIVALDLNPAGAEALMAGVMPVSDNGGSLTVDGTVTATGPLTDTQLRATAVPVSGTVTASGPLTDTQLRATPVPVSGTVATGALTDTQLRATAVPVSLAANQSVNQAQVAGTTTDTNSGAKSAGTQRVVIATDQPQLTNALKVDPSAVTSPVSLAALPALVAGTANIGDVDVLTLPALPAGSNAIGKLAANSGVDIGDVDVTSLPALPAGSNLIGRVQVDASTANGCDTFHLVSAGSTNATNVKASAGKVYGWYIYNSNAAARKVAFHNTAGTPTAGASIHSSIVIPPTSAANVFSETAVTFATGIAITTVTELTDAGATGVAASDLIINIYYK